MKHCDTLVCKATFTFKNGGKGRVITFKEGQKFWITNSTVSIKRDGLVNVARPTQHAGCGYNFTVEQVEQFFTNEG